MYFSLNSYYDRPGFYTGYLQQMPLINLSYNMPQRYVGFFFVLPPVVAYVPFIKMSNL